MKATASTDRRWSDRGACRDEDPDLFFQRSAEQEALSICARCPVLTECRETALRTLPEYGVLGGTTGRERRGLRKRRQLRGPTGRFQRTAHLDTHVIGLLLDGVSVPGASPLDRAHAALMLRPHYESAGEVARRIGASPDNVRRWFRKVDAGLPLVAPTGRPKAVA